MRDIYVSKLSKEPQNIEQSNFMWNKRAKEFVNNVRMEKEDPYMNFLKKYIEIKNNTFIDIGCGTSKYIKLLLDESSYVEGLEPSIQMLNQGKNYLKDMGYNPEDIVFYNQAFQDFDTKKQYDYVFISNSPVISYYENYEKILKLAKKGIFIGSWLGNKDSLLEKISSELKIKSKSHGGMDIIYMFNLFIEDGYYPSFDTFLDNYEEKVNPETLYQRYTSWVYGLNYTDENVSEIKSIISKYVEDGKVLVKTSSSRGMMFVDLEKRI